MSVVKGVRLVGHEAKGNARQYFEAMRDSVDPALHAWVVVEDIVVKVVELKNVPIQNGTSD